MIKIDLYITIEYVIDWNYQELFKSYKPDNNVEHFYENPYHIVKTKCSQISTIALFTQFSL